MLRIFASLILIVAMAGAAVPRAHDAQAAVRASFATLDALTAATAHMQRAAPTRWIPVADYDSTIARAPATRPTP